MARVETELNCTPHSVETARRFIETALAVWELDDLNACAMLLTSELVTNAILHARTAVRLVAERTDKELVVEVWDGAPCAMAAPRHAGVSETGRGLLRETGRGLLLETGRGLLLVDRLASRWGVRRVGQRKVAWFALPLMM